jgi:hypothetical protein
MQKIIFELLFPSKNRLKKRGKKSEKIKKKFLETQKDMVFIFEKVKLRVGLYFSRAI